MRADWRAPSMDNEGYAIMENNFETGDPKFTILLPVHRGPHLLPYAIASVLRQSEKSFELFIVCDGAPDETADYARTCEASDPRVRAFVFAKGERHGEAHRHFALSHAKGRFVAQIADDDLWFEDHLRELDLLLQSCDFGHLLHTEIGADEIPAALYADLRDPKFRSVVATRRVNFSGPTAVGYRLDTYRRLPLGWSPAPANVWSDLFMWRKFLALPQTRFGTRIAVTSLHLGSPARRDWSEDRRKGEMARWAGYLKDPKECDRIRQTALHNMCGDAAAFHSLASRVRRFIKASAARRKALSQ
jgi:glycosyltransferase involved in cell wall biosynthesis